MSLQSYRTKAVSSVTPEQRQSLIQAMILVVLAIFALIGHSILTAWLGGLGLLWLAGLTVVAMFVNLEFAFALMMSGLFLQNAFAALVSPMIQNVGHFSILLGSNMVNLLLSSFISIMAWLKWRSRMPHESKILLMWLGIMFLTVGFYAALGAVSASLSNAVIYSRVYLIGILMLMTGAVMGLRVQLGFVINVIRIMSILLVAWGVLEFFMTYELYSFFHILDYRNLKSINLDNTLSFGSVSEIISRETVSYLNLSGQFGLDLFFLRPRGPNIHSISYGYALAFCCLICFVNRFTFLSIACFIMAALVGAKGALIITLMAMLLCLFYEQTKSRLWLIWGILGAMGLYLFGGLAYGVMSDDYHVLGFLGGLKGFFTNPIGHGIGMGGSLSSMGQNEADFESFQHAGAADFGLESALGVMLYQMGIGTGVFLVFYWHLWKSVWDAATFFKEPRLMLVPIVLALLLINSVFQEEALSPLGWGLWLLFSGLMIGRHWWQGYKPPATA